MTQGTGSDEQLQHLLDDHEQYVGEEMADPWNDPSQTDWPNAAPIEVDDVPGPEVAVA